VPARKPKVGSGVADEWLDEEDHSLGHVYEGLMVDVQATNTKLLRRSEMILAQLTGHGRDKVHDALRQARGSVKLALLVLEGNALEASAAALDAAEGDLRAAKEAVEKHHHRKRRA
jgi:N-acetylmuramic acid 6-phosphate etherase